MKGLELDLSPAQKLKLKKGLKVRVKPAMEGCGITVLMNPSNYDIATRSFSRGKAKQMSLSVDELEANRAQKLEDIISGQGLFSSIKKGISKGAKSISKEVSKDAKKVAKGAKKVAKSKEMKVVGKVAKKAGSATLDELAKHSGEAGVALGTATAIALGQPELVPAFAMAGKEIAERATPLARKAVKDKTGMGLYASSAPTSGMGLRSGNDGYRERAGMSSVEANHLASELCGRGIYASSGRGLYASSASRGNGLYASSAPVMRGFGVRTVGNTLSMTEGQLLGKHEQQRSHLLKSTPFSENFHQQVQLPSQYHKFHQ